MVPNELNINRRKAVFVCPVTVMEDFMASEYDSLKKDDLLNTAWNRDLEVDENMTKAEIIAALEADDAKVAADYFPEEEKEEVAHAAIDIPVEGAALAIVARIAAADSRWADCSSDDRAALDYAVEMKWLTQGQGAELSQTMKNGRYMLTNAGIREIEYRSQRK